ncbi:MAG: hypothetical protein ACYDGY_03575 [Acidimicrobiales bacterium]
MDTLEIIREIERDDALRASLRAVLLGDELLGLPDQLRLLTAEVSKLTEAQRRTEVAQRRTDATVAELSRTVSELTEAQRRTEVAVNRLAEDIGEISEVSCAAVLQAVAEMKGWTTLDSPGPIDVGTGEVDVRAHFSTPEGEVVILAEAKSRLYGKNVSKWASRVGEPTWRNKFLYPGFDGQVLPCIYGTLIYADAIVEARRLGVGVIGPEGERLVPLPL